MLDAMASCLSSVLPAVGGCVCVCVCVGGGGGGASRPACEGCTVGRIGILARHGMFASFSGPSFAQPQSCSTCIDSK